MRPRHNKSNRSFRGTEIPEAICLTFLHVVWFLYLLYILETGKPFSARESP